LYIYIYREQYIFKYAFLFKKEIYLFKNILGPRVVGHACNLSYSGAEVRGWEAKVQVWPRQKYKSLYEKQTKSKKTGGMAQVVEYLLSKSKAPSSIPSIAIKKKKTCFISRWQLDLHIF
jgi:hypothetical protein